VTFLSGVGTLIVILGVILYNGGREGGKKAGLLNMDSTTMITCRDV